MARVGLDAEGLRRALVRAEHRVAELESEVAGLAVRAASAEDRVGRLAEQLQNLADNDPLTDVANRQSFERALEAQTSAMARYGPDGALLVLHLDRYAEVRAALGDGPGSDLLVAVAEGIRQRLRATDLVGRVDVGTFAILLPRGGPDDARFVAQVLVDVTRGVGTDAITNGLVTAAVGILHFDGTETPAVALEQATHAAAGAADAGGDRWAEHEPHRRRGATAAASR